MWQKKVATRTEGFQMDNGHDDQLGKYPAFTFSMTAVDVLGTLESKEVRNLEMPQAGMYAWVVMTRNAPCAMPCSRSAQYPSVYDSSQIS
jgi:hypothetical protein